MKKFHVILCRFKAKLNLRLVENWALGWHISLRQSLNYWLRNCWWVILWSRYLLFQTFWFHQGVDSFNEMSSYKHRVKFIAQSNSCFLCFLKRSVKQYSSTSPEWTSLASFRKWVIWYSKFLSAFHCGTRVGSSCMIERGCNL